MTRRLGSRDVTEGYVRPTADHLRGCAERIAKFLLKKAGAVVPGEQRDAG